VKTGHEPSILDDAERMVLGAATLIYPFTPVMDSEIFACCP
jgi:hypothetical protein